MSEQQEPGPEPESARESGSGPARGSGRTGVEGARSGAATGRRPSTGAGSLWWTFRHSPFLPASVMVLIVAAAAGLFAGSYTYAMADPAPHDIPAAVVGGAEDRRETRAFVDGMEKALGSSLKLHRYRTFAAAERAVDDQQIFMVLRENDRGRIEMNLSSASGASVAEVLQKAAPEVGRKAGVEVVVKDLNPLGRGDPRGLTIFYITLAADIIGFIGAIQLNVNAPGLSRRAKIVTIAAYALLGGFVIAAMVGWFLDAVPLPFVHSWMILTLTMFTSGMVFMMFNTLFGRWAMIPTWVLMVLLGNPSSGGAVSWPLLPSALGAVGRWLPPGASVNAQHTAVYFPGNLHVLPYAVLVAWAVIAVTVFLTLDERLRGDGKPAAPTEADA